MEEDRMKTTACVLRWFGAAVLVLVCTMRIVAAETAARDVTFISTSDSHYVSLGTRHKDRNAANRQTILAINEVDKLEWPESLDGGSVDAPRGVLLLGDVIDDGDHMFEGKNISKLQYDSFLYDFGFDGTDGLLKWPVFETWGNHDGPPVGKERHGFSFQSNLKKRNARRKEKGLVSNLSSNGLHYSWDWDDVHLVSLGIYPADAQNPRVRYNKVWHDPQGALSFLRRDLAAHVGNSDRPVILMAHCGMDTDWWNAEDWRGFYDTAKPYNIAAYIYGHSGTGCRHWAPDGEQDRLLCLNDGQTENGFFVIQLKGDRMRYGYYGKIWRTETGEKGLPVRTWTGQWKWRFTAKADLATSD